MKTFFSTLITVVVCATLGFTNALPVRPLPTDENTGLKTRSPHLRSLTLSGNSLTLLHDKISKSDEEYKTTVQSASVDPETSLRLGLTGSTIKPEITQEKTDGANFRGIRSVTFSDTQAPVEQTTKGTPSQDTNSNPVHEEISTSPIEEVTTPNLIKEETTDPFGTEIPTGAPAVVLDHEFLDNASGQVVLLLAQVDKQVRLIGVSDYIPDESYRPFLPSDVLDNSRQCAQIQLTLLAMHEVLLDFLPHIESLITLTGDRTISHSTRTLAWLISVSVSPPLYDYSPEGIQATGTKNTEEVLNTLGALTTQASIIRQVILNLKNC